MRVFTSTTKTRTANEMELFITPREQIARNAQFHLIRGESIGGTCEGSHDATVMKCIIMMTPHCTHLDFADAFATITPIALKS